MSDDSEYQKLMDQLKPLFDQLDTPKTMYVMSDYDDDLLDAYLLGHEEKSPIFGGIKVVKNRYVPEGNIFELPEVFPSILYKPIEASFDFTYCGVEERILRHSLGLNPEEAMNYEEIVKNMASEPTFTDLYGNSETAKSCCESVHSEAFSEGYDDGYATGVADSGVESVAWVDGFNAGALAYQPVPRPTATKMKIQSPRELGLLESDYIFFIDIYGLPGVTYVNEWTDEYLDLVAGWTSRVLGDKWIEAVDETVTLDWKASDIPDCDLLLYRETDDFNYSSREVNYRTGEPESRAKFFNASNVTHILRLPDYPSKTVNF